MQRDTKLYTMMDAFASSGSAGTAIQVDDFQHIIMYMTFDGSVKVMIQGSISDVEPGNWDALPTVGSELGWGYVSSVDLNSGSTIAGTVGYTGVTSTFQNNLVKVNTVGLKWVNIIMTETEGGTPDSSATVKVRLFNNS